MNTAKSVDVMLTGWKTRGDSKAQIVTELAEACLGWSYVFGARGEYCTPANRRSYADRSTCPEAEANSIRKKCQQLNGSKTTCSGCTWYPNGQTRVFDCRGFTYWVLKQVGIIINGAGATSQYNTNANWIVKGDIADMPKDCVCCVFKQNQTDHKTMEHTGLHVGNGRIIHCSGTVKEGKTTERGWTHYAVPVGLDGVVPSGKPTLRRGAKGEYVTLLQTKLIQQGYDCGKWGADGSFGAATEAAVKKYQADHGLAQDGVCGKNTWEAIDSGEPVKMYTVRIPHLTKSVAESLAAGYKDATITEE